MQIYSASIEVEIRDFYWSLSERDRRRYAAIEARKLGRGGISYIAGVVGCDRHTIAQGMEEVSDPESLAQVRIRQEGGGRKPSLDVIPDLETAFLKVLDHYTAGLPTRGRVKWTNLTQKEIAHRLEEHGIKVSVTVVKQLLKKHGFVRRKALKKKRTGDSQHRDEQFVKIAKLKEEFAGSPNPVISIDTKKKS